MVKKRRRKIIVSIATSADGYIARRNGSVDWLERPEAVSDYGMGAFYRTIDTILWGRKTYEVALKFQKQGIEGAEFDQKVKNYVFSRRALKHPTPYVELAPKPLPSFVKRLRARPGRNIWMMGGSGIIGSFLDQGAIDEFIIHVIPVFIGDGIPLIKPKRRTVNLELLSSRRFADGVVRLRYAVLRGGARTTKKRRKRSPRT